MVLLSRTLIEALSRNLSKVHQWAFRPSLKSVPCGPVFFRVLAANTNFSYEYSTQFHSISSFSFSHLLILFYLEETVSTKMYTITRDDRASWVPSTSPKQVGPDWPPEGQSVKTTGRQMDRWMEHLNGWMDGWIDRWNTSNHLLSTHIPHANAFFFCLLWAAQVRRRRFFPPGEAWQNPPCHPWALFIGQIWWDMVLFNHVKVGEHSGSC